MSIKRILIVEDDKHISKLLRYNLEKAGFQCLTAFTGEQALALLDQQPADAIILDIMLPMIDGLEVCRRVKQDSRFSRIPVMMLTAKGEEVDRVVGFELGADDYIVKPFSPRELILRIKAVLRRSAAPEPGQEVLSAGPLSVDISRHKVFVSAREIELTQMEFKLLYTLVHRQGRVQSRETLLDDVWEMDAAVTTRTIDTHIKKLRQKLGKAGGLIETVRGIGYRFSEEE